MSKINVQRDKGDIRKPGIISWDILRHIQGVMQGHGIPEDEIDCALKGVYVYDIPEGEE